MLCRNDLPGDSDIADAPLVEVVPENSDRMLRCISPCNGGIRDEGTTPVYGRFQGQGVALEALRGDKSIQEISTRHKVHPNQVSTWKRQAMDGLGAVFSGGADKAGSDHEAEVHDLHAKIDQLTVERDFLAKGLKR